MELEITIVTIILFISFFITSGIALYSHVKGFIRGQNYFTILMVLIAWHSFAGTIESAATNIEDKILWSKFEYFGASFSNVFALLFAVNYIRAPRKGIFKNLWLFAIIPSIIFILAITNEQHHLVWKSYEWSKDGINVLVYNHGIGFYTLMVYALLMIAISVYVFVQAISHQPEILRKQSKVFILACTPPFILIIFYSAGLSPIKGLDLSIMSYSITGIILLYGIFKYGMFKIIPVVSTQITNVIQDGLLVLDQHNEIVFHNKAASKILGFSEETLSYQDFKKIDWLHQVKSLKDTKAGETEILISVDPEKWLEIKTNEIKNDEGFFKGSLLFMHDISHRKRLENQSRKLLDELHYSHQQMKEANSQKDRIVSIIAHDLRNPFHQIINLSSLIADMFDDISKDQLKEFLNDILKTSEEGKNTLEELLLWAKTQQLQSFSKIDQVLVYDALQPIITSVSISLKEKMLDIKIEGDPQLVISTDSRVFNFVVRNLLANAIKFSNKGSIITILIEKGKECHSIHFTDTGVGIPQEDLSKLFNSKIKYSRKGTGGESGSGLGLLLCKEMIERNNGTIEVQSKENQGSTFSVKFIQPELN